MTAVDELVARACDRIPGLVQGALTLLPEGLLLAGVGAESVLDLEPLLRSAVRCFESGQPFIEYVFLLPDQLVVIQGGRRDPRLALAVTCTREPTIAFALTAARLAVLQIEHDIDLAAWGL